MGWPPHSRGMPNRPAHTGVDHSKTPRAANPIPEGFEGLARYTSGQAPLPFSSPPRGHGDTTRMAWKSVGRFTGDRQSLEDEAEA